MADETKRTPWDVATRDPATGHAWVRNGDLAPWYPALAATQPELVFCLRCSRCKRRDGPNKPCTGPTRIGLRTGGDDGEV